MPDRPSTPLPSRARWGAAAVVLLLGILAIGCSDSSGTSDSSTTTSTPAPQFREVSYTDPAVPITIELGRRFSIMLPADPGSGWRWVLAPVDNAFLVPLGSEFSDDPDLAAQTSPAVTAFTTTTAYVTTTLPPDATTTTTTAILPLTQIISFAGKGVGGTTATFRYEQIGTPSTEQPRTATFTITITPMSSTTTTR
jgi:hypothetical protein